MISQSMEIMAREHSKLLSVLWFVVVLVAGKPLADITQKLLRRQASVQPIAAYLIKKDKVIDGTLNSIQN